ncbi:hypothetical protein HPB51_009522 [Rhipicephalus microplus]|uniref:Uncharacterized protein n=1 Tax=Rhipicephalus microplus TaxID=6941 RepID=A0A9J6F1Z3_RHIMP|nr:hypothetical protein HPB51_009522 [Rhipicephalus microplus]
MADFRLHRGFTTSDVRASPTFPSCVSPGFGARWHRRDFSCVHLLALRCCGHLLSSFAAGSRWWLSPLRVDAALGQLRRMSCQEPNVFTVRTSWTLRAGLPQYYGVFRSPRHIDASTSFSGGNGVQAPVSNRSVGLSHCEVVPCIEHASESPDSSQAACHYLTDEPSPHATILHNANGRASEPSGSHVSRQGSPFPATAEGRLSESSDSSMLLEVPEQCVSEPVDSSSHTKLPAPQASTS